MPKSYTIEYLKVYKNMLDDATADVQLLINKNKNAGGDGPSTARKELKAVMQKIDNRFKELAADARQMNYTDFKTKYIEHL